MDPRQRGETYRGADRALAMAFDLTLTPAIFGFLGYRLDRWVGSMPVFTIVLSMVALSYVVWKAYVAYEAEMQVHEARLRGNRDRGRRSRPTTGQAA